MLSVKGIVNQNVGGVTFNVKSRKVVQQNNNAIKKLSIIYNNDLVKPVFLSGMVALHIPSHNWMQ